jgi:hypothetical protein
MLFFAGFGFLFFNKKKSQPIDNPLIAKDFSEAEIKKNDPENPVELGRVHWSNDYNLSREAAKKSGKPVLILFQEVPGCATCTRYGNQVLSHPLLVEAIETFFEPVCIRNNKPGEDRRILEKFGEPAWNNPVIRIISAENEADLVPRISGNYTPFGLAESIVETFKIRSEKVPIWLDLLKKSLKFDEKQPEEVFFSMPCFWSGEGKLGNLEGVVATEAGFMNGCEVVKVKYDSDEISFEQLCEKSRESSCANQIFCENKAQLKIAGKVIGQNLVTEKSTFRPDREPKYYLQQTIWRFVPMTENQAGRANALVGSSKSPDEIFSPRQIALAAKISENSKKKWKNCIGSRSIIEDWAVIEKKLSQP